MENRELSLQYVTAQGPDGLTEVLSDFLDKAKTDPDFAATGHYILYQLGNQKSLIKVDMSQEPYQFWYNDLLGRPATKLVKDTIARFLWDKCGERERFFQQFQGD